MLLLTHLQRRWKPSATMAMAKKRRIAREKLNLASKPLGLLARCDRIRGIDQQAPVAELFEPFKKLFQADKSVIDSIVKRAVDAHGNDFTNLQVKAKVIDACCQELAIQIPSSALRNLSTENSLSEFLLSQRTNLMVESSKNDYLKKELPSNLSIQW